MWSLQQEGSEGRSVDQVDEGPEALLGPESDGALQGCYICWQSFPESTGPSLHRLPQSHTQTHQCTPDTHYGSPLPGTSSLLQGAV